MREGMANATMTPSPKIVPPRRTPVDRYHGLTMARNLPSGPMGPTTGLATPAAITTTAKPHAIS